MGKTDEPAWREILAPWPERCAARVEDNGNVLEFSCSHRAGHAIHVDIWNAADSSLRQQEPIALDFAFLRGPNTDDEQFLSYFADSDSSGQLRHYRVMAKVNPHGRGAAIQDPAAYQLGRISGSGLYKNVTVSGAGRAHTFWLSEEGGDAIRRVAWVGDPVYFPDAIKGDSWKTFTYADQFEIEMPDNTARDFSLYAHCNDAGYCADFLTTERWNDADWERDATAPPQPSDGELRRFEISGLGERAYQREVSDDAGKLSTYRYIKTSSHKITLSVLRHGSDPEAIARRDRFFGSLRIL